MYIKACVCICAHARERERESEREREKERESERERERERENKQKGKCETYFTLRSSETNFSLSLKHSKELRVDRTSGSKSSTVGITDV